MTRAKEKLTMVCQDNDAGAPILQFYFGLCLEITVPTW